VNTFQAKGASEGYSRVGVVSGQRADDALADVFGEYRLPAKLEKVAEMRNPAPHTGAVERGTAGGWWR
jgi:hypothetical protein